MYKMSSSSKSKKAPNISPETHTILVSPKSTHYLLYESKKSILWSYDLNIRVCDAYHEINASNENNVRAYIDAETDPEGNIELYHRSSSDSRGVMIEWTSHEDLKSYVTKNFGNGIIFDYFTSHVKLDHISGNPSHRSSKYFRIDRSAYMISEHSRTSKWHVDFSIYEVTFFEKEDSFLRLHVKHSCTEEVFISCCRMMKDYRFLKGLSRDLSLEDICLRHELKVEKISIDIPLKEATGSHMVRGEYVGFAAAIKTMNMAGIATKKKNLVLSNLNDNICRWFGRQTKENGDLLFAFEHCRYTLYDFLDSSPDKLEIMAVVRGVVRGVYHLHLLNLGHGNITPWSLVLTEESVPKLCGIETCRRLSDELRGVDLQGLGYLIAYCFSNARLSITTEEQYNISDSLLNELCLTKEMEAYHMADSLLHCERNKPSFLAVLAHPWNWNPSKKLQFIRDANDVLQQSPNFYLRSGINKLMPNNLLDGNWKNKFPKELVTHMEKELEPNLYTFYGACNLMRFLRNIISHMWRCTINSRQMMLRTVLKMMAAWRLISVPSFQNYYRGYTKN